MVRLWVMLVGIVLVVVACKYVPGNNKQEGKAIARVNDKYLYKEDILHLIPAGTSANDSTEIISAFINDWVRQELLLKQAEDNLAEESRDFTKQIEQYRNSLIIYAYESELVRQKLDTVISESEIEDYYNKNQDNFQLRENIVLANYVIINKNSPVVGKIKSLLLSIRETDKEKLISLCQENGADFSLNDGSWIPFTDLTRKIPLKVDDQEEFLAHNKYYQVKDSTSLYLVAIQAYKNKESVSPLSFEANNIRAILLNKRKADLLTQMEQDLFSEAVRRNKYEILKK